MGLKDILKSIWTASSRKDYSTLRPSELDPWTRGASDIAKVPSVPFLGYRFVMEVYMYSDLLRTIIRSLVQETFRKGITVVPKFVVKCVYCGTEYQTEVHRCEVCGGNKLRGPNPYEGKWLREWIHDVNFNDQSLIEVLQDVDHDLNIYDNAYLAVIKKYEFNGDRVIGAEVVEVIRANPEYVMLVMDRNGRPARTDDGDVVLFCLIHRDSYKTVRPEDIDVARCDVCGRKLYPAYFLVRKWRDGRYVCYTNGEMIHIKKFTHGLGYGLSPIFAVWMKILTLLKQDYFILTAYHLERTPKGLLILRGNFEAIQKAWRRLQEEAKTNPHIVYPLIVEGADNINRVAEWLDLTFKSDDIDFIQYRDEVRRTVGALWGVMPIFHGDMSVGAGLANEGLQIVVTNRAVEREQSIFNEKVLPWLVKQLGVMDWEIRLVPNEGRDMAARIQRESMRIANAEKMARLGYRPLAVKTDDGIDFDYEEMETGQIVPGIGSSKVGVIPRLPVSERKLPRYEGEPEHGRPRAYEQRFEGEELARRPKVETFIVGEGGKLIPEEEFKETTMAKQGEEVHDVPVRYRRYIEEADLPMLPVGTRVYRGPRGGMYIDRRQVSSEVLDRIGGKEEKESEEEDTEIREAMKEFYGEVDEEEVEILKAGWHLGVKRYGKGRGVAGVVGYEEWPEYAGLGKALSEQINAWLWDQAFLQKTLRLDKLVDGLVKRFGIEKSQAENIVRTEMGNIFNKMREWAYLTETKVQKFKWVAKHDACEKCQTVAQRTAKGVTMDELKQIIKEVGGEAAREWTVHPQCRCTFVRAYGKGRGWEGVGI